MKYESEAGKREKRGKTFLLLRGGLRMGKKRPSFLHNLVKNVSAFRGSKHKQLLNLFAPNLLVLGNKKTKKTATATKVPQK